MTPRSRRAPTSHRGLSLALLALLALGLGACASADDEASSTADDELTEASGSPSDYHGVKIKHPGGDNDIRHTCVYTTGSSSRGYGGVVRELAAHGIRDLFIKRPQPNQVPSYCTDERLDAEIVAMLSAIASFNASRPQGTPAMRAWVWERTWLWMSGDGAKQGSYDDYVTHMTSTIHGAKKAGVASALEGIGIIETNLPGSDSVQSTSVSLAHDINAKTNGWLRRHSFLFPGAGMGSWFKNIDQGKEAFYGSMAKEVKYFSFIYKFMPSQDSNPKPVNAKLAPYYYGPNAVWTDEVRKPASAQRTYLEDTLGFGDLRTMIDWGRRNGHGALAHVVFWGDSGDGVEQMRPESVEVMHQLLVEEVGEPGSFFDFALLGATQEDAKTRAKYVLVDDGSHVAENGAAAWNDGGGAKYATSMSVWDEWARWPKAAAGY